MDYIRKLFGYMTEKQPLSPNVPEIKSDTPPTPPPIEGFKKFCLKRCKNENK